MKPLKKIAALLVLIVGIFAFTTNKNTPEKALLNLDQINILELLEEQQLSCRPTSNYVFFVETELQEKLRGANTIKAKVFIQEKSSGKSNLVSSETIVVPKYKGAIHLDDKTSNAQLTNGDRIVSSTTTHSLKQLIQFETIHNSYLKSTNELLNLKRSI